MRRLIWFIALAFAFALLQGPSGVLHASMDFVIAGNLKSAIYGNGISTSYDYNARHHLRRIRTVNSAQTLLANFDYDGAGSDASALAGSWGTQGLSKSGRRNRMDENVNGTLRSILYGYDELNRLTKESNGSSAVTYDAAEGYEDASGYDKVGNRRSRTSNLAGVDPQPNRNYDKDDQLDNHGNSEPRSKLYDANGNRIEGGIIDSEGNLTRGGVSYQYDWANRLIRAQGSGLDVTIVYDGDGHRVKKTANGATTFYLVDDRNPTGYAQVIEERATATTSSPSVTYIYGLDLVSQTRSGATHYYGYDGLGTVRYLTNTGATIGDTYTADAFGIEIARTGSTPNNYRYTGEQWDADLGLYYLRARYYNPAEGRFLTLDTFEGDQNNPLTLHKYLYVHADPVNRIDPSGHVSIPEFSISTAIRESLHAFRAAPQAVMKQAVKQYAKNIAEAFDFRDQDENRQLSQAAERLWTMRLQLHGFKVVNLVSFGQKGPDLVAFGKSGGRYHLIVGEVKGTRRARVMSMLDQLEDRTIQMSAHWIQMGLESILDGVMGMLPELSQYAGGRLSALLDRGEFDLYLLRARDMRNNTWILTGYPLLQVNLPGGGGIGKGVKRGDAGDVRELEQPRTFNFPSVP